MASYFLSMVTWTKIARILIARNHRDLCTKNSIFSGCEDEGATWDQAAAAARDTTASKHCLGWQICWVVVSGVG